MPESKAHLCKDTDLVKLECPTRQTSRYAVYEGTIETCSPPPGWTSRGVEIWIKPNIHSLQVEMDFKIWSEDKTAPEFKIYDIKMQLLDSTEYTQFTVSAASSVPSEAVYWCKYRITVKK